MDRQIVSAAEADSERTQAGLAPTAIADTAASDRVTADNYRDKLIKHIPAEAIAVYLTLQGIIQSGANPGQVTGWLWVAFAIGLVGTPLYLWRLQNVISPVQLSISTASFAIWVYGLGGAFARYGWYQTWTASVVLIAFTFMVPVVIGSAKPKKTD